MMRPIPARPLWFTLCAAALLVSAGCASVPPVAEKMAESPMGTVHTFHRKSSGSLGAFDGPVVWTQGPGTWQGQPVLAIGSPQAGVTLHQPGTLAILANLNPQGQPVMSYDPPVDFPWPLKVGKTWTANHTVTLHPSGRTVAMTIRGKVESWGEVTVPAGTYRAYKLVWTNNLGETETRWVAPADGISPVKRHVERPASHPQGAGVLDAELIKREVPGR